MAIITAPEEIDKLRQSGQILAAAMRKVVAAVKPGATTGHLNLIAEREIKNHDAIPAFHGYQGYPASLCVSVNQEVVHGIPDLKRALKDGDIVGLDLGVNYQDFYTDHAVTVGVGEISAAAANLITATKNALDLALKQVRAGRFTGDIGAAIQKYIEPQGFGVVRQLTGHGVGRDLHEPPVIPNVGPAGTGAKLETGMVLAIEPMITGGDWRVKTLADGWTVVTVDNSLAAHFEHTVIVTVDGAEIITK